MNTRKNKGSIALFGAALTFFIMLGTGGADASVTKPDSSNGLVSVQFTGVGGAGVPAVRARDSVGFYASQSKDARSLVAAWWDSTASGTSAGKRTHNVVVVDSFPRNIQFNFGANVVDSVKVGNSRKYVKISTSGKVSSTAIIDTVREDGARLVTRGDSLVFFGGPGTVGTDTMAIVRVWSGAKGLITIKGVPDIARGDSVGVTMRGIHMLDSMQTRGSGATRDSTVWFGDHVAGTGSTVRFSHPATRQHAEFMFVDNNKNSWIRIQPKPKDGKVAFIKGDRGIGKTRDSTVWVTEGTAGTKVDSIIVDDFREYAVTVGVYDSIPTSDISFEAGSKVFVRGTSQHANGAIVPAARNEKFGGEITEETYEYWDGSKYLGRDSVPTDVGVYTVKAFVGNSSYYGTKTSEYRITRKKLSASDVTIEVADPEYSGQSPFMFDSLSKTPTPIVTDGGNILSRDVDYTVSYEDNVWAGVKTGKVVVTGKGNYDDQLVGRFTIAPAPVSVAAFRSYVYEKTYDGTAAIPVLDSVRVLIVGFEKKDSGFTDNFVKYTPALNYAGKALYTWESGPVFDEVNAGDVNVTGTIRLNTTSDSIGSLGNYVLDDGSFSRSAKIKKKRAVDSTDFVYTIPPIAVGPTAHFYNGEDQGIGAVTFSGVLRNPTTEDGEGFNVKVLYGKTNSVRTGSGPNTVVSNLITGLPSDTGTYTVWLDLRNGLNFVDTIIQLANYRINPPAKPAISSPTTNQAISVRAENTRLIAASVKSPNEGVLTYQWYRDSVAVGSGTDSVLAITPSVDDVGKVLRYWAIITNSHPGVQHPDSIRTITWSVTVQQPATDIGGAVVTVTAGKLTYDGSAKVPTSGNIKVVLGGTTIATNQYTYTITNNTNAGNGVVTVTGVDNFKGTALGTFPIERKTLERKDFTFAATRPYNGEQQGVVITATPVVSGNVQYARTGLGTTTVTYDGSAAIPSTAGIYPVSISFADDGRNFTGDTVFTDTFTIMKKVPQATDVIVTETGLPFVMPQHRVTGAPQGIGAPETDFKLRGTGYGTLTVTYNNAAAIPSAVGDYTVKINVQGGANYYGAEFTLGTYRIVPIPTYAISITAPGSGGTLHAKIDTVTFTGGTVQEGTVIVFTATPRDSFVVREWRVGGAAVQEGGLTYTHTVTAAAAVSVLLYNPSSVASNDRVIPGSTSEQAIVAPVIKLTGEFTVGPNPVANASGKVAFFWQGKSVSKGTLFVFDASGNLVKKIGIADVKGLGTDRREIGSWNLADAKGRPIAEGTYLVKGVLTVGGEKVKVSSILGVR